MGRQRTRNYTKSQHFITRAYLEYFAGNKGVSALCKRDGHHFTTNPANVASRSYLYETELTRASKEGCPQDRFIALNHIENGISQIENRCISALHDVCKAALDERYADGEISPDSTDLILAFALHTVQRSPYALEDLREIVKSDLGGVLLARALEMGRREGLPSDPPALTNEAANRFILTDRGMGYLSEHIVNQWRNCMRIVTIAPRGTHFVTSDLPLLAEAGGQGEPTILYMPLSSRVGILFDRTHPTRTVRRVGFMPKSVDEINGHYFGSKNRCEYVYGPDEGYLLKLYAQAREAETSAST